MNFAGNCRKFMRCLKASAEHVRRSLRAEQGWALISVLYVVAMLALMAAATQALMVSSAAIEKKSWDRTRLRAVLDAATAQAVLGITDSRIDRRLPIDGTKTDLKFDGTDVRVRIQDQLGLIDLNAADGSMIKRLLLSVGLSDDDAAQMTDRILAWRSASGLTQLQDVSDTDYAATGIHPRHGPFQSVAELRLVLGMTPALFARLEPALTVYSGRPAFDTNVAPEAVLRALYLDRPDHVSRILAERQHGNGLAGRARGVVLSSALSAAGRTFSITAEARLGAKRFERKTVVLLTGDTKRPYLILAWQ